MSLMEDIEPDVPFFETTDQVNHPDHYKVGGYEAIDVIQAKLTKEEFGGFCKGNALNYLMRSNYKKHHDEDLQKAEWYLSRVNQNESDG